MGALDVKIPDKIRSMPMIGLTVVYFGPVNAAVVACHMCSLRHSSGEYNVNRNGASRKHQRFFFTICI